MKTNIIAIAMIGLSSLATLPLSAGTSVSVQIGTPPPVVVAPPPAVVVEAVPDVYIWDGVEFIGVVGTDYFYLGPGKVWLPCDAIRVTRFHEWERVHTDWRLHAIRNELYRRDAHGHEVPRHDVREINHDVHEIRHDARQDAHEIRHDVHEQEKHEAGHDKNNDGH